MTNSDRVPDAPAPLPPVPDGRFDTGEWIRLWLIVIGMCAGPFLLLMVAMSL